MVSDREFTFSSAVEPTKKKCNTCFDCAIYTTTHFSQNMVPVWQWSTCDMSVFFAEPKFEFYWEIVAGLSVAPTEICINVYLVVLLIFTVKLILELQTGQCIIGLSNGRVTIS